MHLREDYKLSFKNILFHISIQGSSSPENVDFTLLDHYTNIYSKTLVNFSERAVKRMKDDEGSIIFISSPGCNNTEPVRPGYGVPGIFNLHLFTQMKWMCLVFNLLYVYQNFTINFPLRFRKVFRRVCDTILCKKSQISWD